MSGLSVLFVCLGNICRSPTAEGVLRRKLEQAGLAGRVRVDSAGTGHWHVGEAPDQRSQAAAKRRGYDLSALRARQVSAADFLVFDYVLAMDEDNLAALQRLAPAAERHRARLYLAWLPDGSPREVPDPYYGGEAGFEQVLDLLEAAADALVIELREHLA